MNLRVESHPSTLKEIQPVHSATKEPNSLTPAMIPDDDLASCGLRLSELT
jgi:hypothetical protein